mmetsp:Transcript_98521/g.234595  ORF Transcript_98521/g.234595 Transcript_98521/m.234595 type:complete len:258 (+) Transcript_98521:375-1148(+)
MRLRGDVSEPSRQGGLHAASAGNLLRDALLGVVEGRQHGLGQILAGAGMGGGTLQEDPGIGEGRGEHILKELHELPQLATAGLVIGLPHRMLDHGILLDQLRVLGVERRKQVRVGRALELLHELQHRILLDLEEPLDALAHVLHPPLERQMSLVAQQLHDHIPPGQRAHGHPPRLDHVALLDLHCNLREAQEDLHLHHQTPKLGTAIHLHVEGADLDLVPQVVDVVVQATEILRRQHAEVRRPQSAMVVVKSSKLLI